MVTYDFHVVFRELIFAAGAPVADEARYEVHWRVAGPRPRKGLLGPKRPSKSQVLPFSEHVVVRQDVEESLPELVVAFRVVEVLSDRAPNTLDTLSFNLLRCPPLKPPAKTRVVGEHCTATFFVFVRRPADQPPESDQIADEVERVKAVRSSLEALRIIVPEPHDGSTPLKHPAYSFPGTPTTPVQASLDPKEPRQHKKELAHSHSLFPGSVSIASAVSEEFPDLSDDEGSSIVTPLESRMRRRRSSSYRQSPRSARSRRSTLVQTPSHTDTDSEIRKPKCQRSHSTQAKEPETPAKLPESPDKGHRTECGGCAIT
eukprot:EG_transcript_13916